jgi:protein-S-isoprenylcysteine O-methyltransferase Ste14
MPAMAQSIRAYVMIFLAVLLGGGSLALMAVFLLLGPVSPLDFDWGEVGILLFDTLLSLAFFVQHSGMVRRGFRHWSGKFFAKHNQGAVYAIASGVVLFAVVLLWQDSNRMIFSAEGVFRWLMRGLFVLGLGGFAWTGRALGTFDPLGIESVVSRLRGQDPPSPLPLTIRGPYRWVRHPFYSCVILMLWSYPDITADRLLFNVLWSAWIVIGAYLEERDMVTDFGEDYSEYRRRVPMLIPWRGRASGGRLEARGGRDSVSTAALSSAVNAGPAGEGSRERKTKRRRS